MKCPAVLVAGLIQTVVILAPAATQAQQQDVATFYRGKTISLYIGYAAGGGFDLYGRLAARHLARHLPGNPNIVPRNQPGAGSIMLANQLYNTLPRDGTALGVIGNSLPLDQLLGSPQILFNSAKFNWIGRFDDLSLLLMASRESGITNADDVLTKEFSIAVPGRGSTGEFALGAIKRLLGTKYKLVSGYRSGQETKLAMERGEVDATASVQWSTFKATNPDWIEQKKVNILVQLGLDRFSDLPNVVLAPELGRTKEQVRILELLMLPARIGRALVAPPDLPADHLAALRSAFEAMLQDPEFKSEADKLNLTLNPLPASSLHEIVERISQMESSLVEQARAIARDP